jgi:hypothetical protein
MVISHSAIVTTAFGIAAALTGQRIKVFKPRGGLCMPGRDDNNVPRMFTEAVVEIYLLLYYHLRNTLLMLHRSRKRLRRSY